MKRFVLAALLLSSPSFAAPHVVKREIKPRVAFGRAPASDLIRTHVLAGSFAQLNGKSCEDLFDALFEAVALKESEYEHIAFSGFASCGAQTEDGPATDLNYELTLEAVTDGDVPLVDAYLAAHSDLMVENNPLVWVRAFGVFAELELHLDFIDKEGAKKEIAERTFKSFYVNQAQVAQAAFKFGESVKTVDTFLMWLAKMTSKDEASYFREELLPETNLISGYSLSTLILDDRRTAFGDFYGPYELDCRSSSNGFCL
jgi:hypothetical protein